MSRGALVASWLLLSGAALGAEEVEPLDAAFLDYLANLEGDEDNWTLLADADQERSSASEVADKASKAPKEAAKPAADER